MPSKTLASRERKRANDRAAQRATRARTKEYIARLEDTVAELSKVSGSERADALEQRFQQQEEETTRLRRTFARIARLVQDGLQDSSSNDTDGSGEDTRLSTVTERRSSDGTTSGSTLAIPSQLEAPRPSADDYFGTFLVCGDGQRNFFSVLSNAIRGVQGSQTDRYSTQREDDDILIRSALHGWDAVVARHHLDPIWTLLRAMDKGFYCKGGLIEKLASMRIVRLMIMKQTDPSDNTRRQIPSYMAPTPVQQAVPHELIIDYFVWPAVRDAFILSSTEECSEYQASEFASKIRFNWPFNKEDVYVVDPSTNTYAFSFEFERRFDDLGNWEMAGPLPDPDMNFATVAPLGLPSSENRAPIELPQLSKEKKQEIPVKELASSPHGNIWPGETMPTVPPGFPPQNGFAQRPAQSGYDDFLAQNRPDGVGPFETYGSMGPHM